MDKPDRPHIPLYLDLRDQPELKEIALRLHLSAREVVGALANVWMEAALQCDELGRVATWTADDVDEFARITGFADAMQAVGWLRVDALIGVELPGFGRYAAARPVDIFEAFDAFWVEYPKKAAKKRALEVWKRLRPSAGVVSAIMLGVTRWKGCRRWRDGYIMEPARWLKERRWEDDDPGEGRPQAAPESPVSDIRRKLRGG